ncbi:MAG: DUF998 domain-containing protein [Desulfurococcales archaeon]|nr:DUF998 domain-containing protein [Desulfurococcales archaeon]
MEDLSDTCRKKPFLKKAIAGMGVASPLLAWIVIGIAWKMNPWFNVLEDAYSDLGGQHATDPWIYNYGLVTVGVLMAFYGALLACWARGKLGVIGASYLALAGVFLVLIGVFHEGTRPHTFVSIWFFIQADIALILLGGEFRDKPLGLTVLLSSLLAFPVAIAVGATVGWPSTAVLETYGILLIDYGVLAITHLVYRSTG